MGHLKRQLLTWGAIVTTTAVLPGLALADNVSPEHGGGRHGRSHRNDNAKLAVAGRAISRGTTDSYGLQIRGHSGEQPTDAGGMIRFAHKSDQLMEGLVGEITCLSRDAAGIVSVTGTIKRSGKREGNGDNGDKNSPQMPGAPSEPKVPTPTAAADDGGALLDALAPWEADDESEVAEPARDGRRSAGELAGKDFAFTIDVPGEPQKFSKPTIGDKGTLAACSGGGDSVEVTRGQFRTRTADAASDGDGGKSDGDRGGFFHRGRRGGQR